MKPSLPESLVLLPSFKRPKGRENVLTLVDPLAARFFALLFCRLKYHAMKESSIMRNSSTLFFSQLECIMGLTLTAKRAFGVYSYSQLATNCSMVQSPRS